MKTLIRRLLGLLHLWGGNWNDMEAVGVCCNAGVSYPVWWFHLPVSSRGQPRRGQYVRRTPFPPQLSLARFHIALFLSLWHSDKTVQSIKRHEAALWSSFKATLASRRPPLTGVKLSLHPVARQLRSQRKMHCRFNYMRTGLENPIMFALLIT